MDDDEKDKRYDRLARAGVEINREHYGPPVPLDEGSPLGVMLSALGEMSTEYLVSCLRCGTAIMLASGQPDTMVIHDLWHLDQAER